MMILCKIHFFFIMVIISRGNSSSLFDNGSVAPTSNLLYTNESDEVNGTFPLITIVDFPVQAQSNEIKVDSSPPQPPTSSSSSPPSTVENPLEFSDGSSQNLNERSQKHRRLLTEFQSELRRNKFLVASSVLKKVEGKLARLRSQLSKLLLQKCPRPTNQDEVDNDDPMTSSLACKEGQNLIEKEIFALEALVNVNKKYRIDSDAFYDHVQIESRKIQDSFKSVMRFFPKDNFNGPDDLEASASELVAGLSPVPTHPNDPRWISVREKFQKLGFVQQVEELVDDEVREENLNGNSEIFKLASLIKNARNGKEFEHLKSKFPTLVQRVIWEKKCQLRLKATDETTAEFKLVGGKNLTVTTNEILKKFPYRHQVAQSWNFIPVEGADFFILENIFRKTLLGASPEATVAVKPISEKQDYAMTLPEFMWRLELRCSKLNSLESQGSRSAAPSLQQKILEDSQTTTGVTQIDVALSLPLPPAVEEEEKEGTTTAMNSLDLTGHVDDHVDEEEDCSQDSLFMNLQNKEFPHLALNVNAKGKVVLTEDPGRFFVE